MSRSGSIELLFAGDDQTFRLRIGELEALQEETGVSPFVLFQRLAKAEPLARDAEHVVRLGLIGGGLDTRSAKALVRRGFEDAPLIAHVALAGNILAAALFGIEDEAPGKAGAVDLAPMETNVSGSPPSMAPEP